MNLQEFKKLVDRYVEVFVGRRMHPDLERFDRALETLSADHPEAVQDAIAYLTSQTKVNPWFLDLYKNDVAENLLKGLREDWPLLSDRLNNPITARAFIRFQSWFNKWAVPNIVDNVSITDLIYMIEPLLKGEKYICPHLILYSWQMYYPEFGKVLQTSQDWEARMFRLHVLGMKD